MRLATRMTIEEFIEHVLQSSVAKKIIGDWPLELTEITRIVVEHFRVMGIYFVEPMAGSKLIETNIIRVLKTSPELQELIRKQMQAQESGRKAKAMAP